MKPVLEWVKSNVLIVVFGVLILLMLPAAWYFSNSWNESIRVDQEAKAKAAWQKVKGQTINYTLPVIEASAEPVSFNEVPNRELIKWFSEKRDVLMAQATAVVEKAEKFNKGVGEDAAAVGRREHVPLVEGVFPGGGPAQLNAMEDALLGKRGHANHYDALLKSVRAGMPAEIPALTSSLQDFRSTEVEKVTANKRNLEEAETMEIQKRMGERRLGEYQARAANVSLYASMESLPKANFGSFVPTGSSIDRRFINLTDFYVFQWDLWILNDFFAAIRNANTVNGRLLNVDQAIVKRIEKMDISMPAGVNRGYKEENPEDDPMRPRTPEPLPSTPVPELPPVPYTGGIVTPDYNLSFTGRLGTNLVYDTRVITTTMVVSSARLPELLSIIERTNFMTVIDMDLEEVKAYEDLQRGYYYGPEHVVRVTMKIETVWLRSWTTQYMPAPLKSALQIPEMGAPMPETPSDVPSAG